MLLATGLLTNSTKNTALQTDLASSLLVGSAVGKY